MKLVVDLLAMGHAPQSKYVKPMRIRGESEKKNSPRDGAFLRYQMIHRVT